jgi:hypothetical protein
MTESQILPILNILVALIAGAAIAVCAILGRSLKKTRRQKVSDDYTIENLRTANRRTTLAICEVIVRVPDAARTTPWTDSTTEILLGLPTPLTPKK